MDVGVLAVGAAAGRLRLDAAEAAAAWGSGGRSATVAVAGTDEDALTLGWDAADSAVHAAEIEPDTIEGLWWGTTRPPFADGPSHAYLAAALGLPDRATGALLTGSPHAGVDALLAAVDAISAGRVASALVVASDAALPALGTAWERRAAAGAVALVLRADGGPATIAPVLTRSRPVLDRYRGDGETATRDLYDPRLFREEVFLPAVVEAGQALGEVGAWSLPDPDGRLGAAAAKRLGGQPTSAAVYGAIGDTGTAAALLGAVPALVGPAEVGVVAYGGGRTTALRISAEEAVLGASSLAGVLTGGAACSYPEALQARGQLVAGTEPIPMGVPPGGAGFVRGSVELLALHGARCVDCGTISTPPSVHPACVGCGGGKLEAVSLDRGGEIHTFVVNQVMPPPFDAPLPIVVLDLDDGARLMVQAIGDGDDLTIGDRMRLVLRRYAVERGAPVYGYKATKDDT